VGLDISKLRESSGAITLDAGYGNTGSCKSAITFIDGEKGILRYRGYPIEELANSSNFEEVAYLLIHGKLPSKAEFQDFKTKIVRHSLINEQMKKFFEGYPPSAHPMAILAAMLVSLSSWYGETTDVQLEIVRLMGKIKTIAGFAYKHIIGQPMVYPRNDLSYEGDFLNMMFSVPSEPYKVSPVIEKALRLLLILHADHEQNCSASTVRMVGSAHSNLYASVAAGVCALWGPLHGGANQEVLEMLEVIKKDNGDYEKYISKAKDKASGFKLMGFGHRVYKNFDPRATIIKNAADQVLAELKVKDPLLDIARGLEKAALSDPYFVERKLYPNVDFYSGIIYRAMGIPTNFFTVMFAMGRLPGWIAQWREGVLESAGKIHRPRQIYIGEKLRHYTPIDKRD
ncbi:MAG TPA: citrate synthase, partial [Candidatus Hodarchaeales archaeon]|nr:citrate synthase [Candidatus Hodarchaeales archaeon]